MSAESHGPHIPALQWELIPWWDFSLFGIDFSISNTILSTWIFMIILFTVLYMFKRAISKESSVLKSTWILIVRKIYEASNDFVWKKEISQKILFLTWWMLVFIFLANIYWLLIDWILLVLNPELHATSYIRPINSDPNTTFAMSISMVIASHIVMVKTKGAGHYVKWYLFNNSWKGFDKFVNIFLWWLHMISELVKILSLALRLFGNIFAWIILISIIAFLGSMVSVLWFWLGEIFVLPFWLFELFVALIQAVVFFVLTSIYFKQATELEH